jgi:tetraacyldisaccharide 4'-kinase
MESAGLGVRIQMRMRRFYLDVVTGRRRGPLAGIVRGLLWVASIVYATLHGLHRLVYRIGLRRAAKLPVRVVSVGNLTAGGTGKSPLVEHIARWFARKNLRVAILARGYGRIDGLRDDEELVELGDNIIRLSGPDRVALARRAMATFRPDVFVLDDGFQHYRLQRDLDILVVDAMDPFSGGRLLPAGLLRERPSAAKRADLIVLTRTDQVAPSELASLRERLERISGGRPIVDTCHKPVAVRTLWNKKRSGVEWLKGRSLYAFCGIGNPEAFRRTLEGAGAKVEKFVAFEDHHRYAPMEVKRINAEAQEFMVEALVTTEKDATKLDPEAFSLPLAALRVEIEVVRGEPQLDAGLQGLVQDLAPVAAAPMR